MYSGRLHLAQGYLLVKTECRLAKVGQCEPSGWPVPELGLDVAWAGRAGVDLFLLLLLQDPLSQQVVCGRDVVVLVRLQGP